MVRGKMVAARTACRALLSLLAASTEEAPVVEASSAGTES